MKLIFVSSLLMLLAPQASAQTPGEPVVVNGTCGPKSGVTIDDGDMSSFACDVAIIARTERGNVLIQFADKSGDDGRILGFAGTIEGKQGFGADNTQMLAVERLYLAGGTDPIPVDRGTCIMNWSGLHRTGGRLTSVLCAARAEAEGSDIKAMAVLEAR